MPNENIMGVPTRACINGFTKEDTERLKNALIKKIVNDDTVIDITDDGKIIVADGNGLYLSFDGNILGLIKDSSGDYIPQTVPYLPEDENENPLVPPSGTIITSDNIAVDPRIVRTTGNQEITGTKTFNGEVLINRLFRRCLSGGLLGTGWIRIYKFGIATSYSRQVLFTVRENYIMKNLNMKLAIQVGNSSGTDSGYTDSGYSFKLARKGNYVEIWVSRGTASSSISLEFEYATASGFPLVDISSEQANPPTVGVDDYTAVVDVQAW